jgi:hypothetical protein
MRFLLSIALLAATWTAGAQGTSEAILSYDANGTAGRFSGETVGWTFQVAAPITVTELGCAANFFPNNPAAAQIEVGLWAPDGSLLAFNSITPGSTLFDQSRYETVAPLALSPGQTYHIGAYSPIDSFSLDAVVPNFGGSVTPGPGILLLGMALGSGAFVFPLAEVGTDGGAYLGPNFRFQSQPSLAIQLGTSNQLRLSWPAAYPGYTLQSKLGLLGAWANAGLSPTLVGNEFVALDTIGPIPKYYRLIK